MNKVLEKQLELLGLMGLKDLVRVQREDMTEYESEMCLMVGLGGRGQATISCTDTRTFLITIDRMQCWKKILHHYKQQNSAVL